ncbi:MAG: hypothetical protein AB8B93_05115 [Pseudomonadales bacterium]
MNWTSVTNVHKALENTTAAQQSADSDAAPADTDDTTVGGERRAHSDRRRSSKGLLELRARRDGVTDDRREAQRRKRAQSLLQRLPLLAWLTRRAKSST